MGLRNIISYYRSRSLVVIGSDFFSQGGAWRSIFAYLRQREARGDAVHLLDLRGARSLRQLAAAFFWSECVLVNGLDAFRHPVVLLLGWMRPGVFVYLHETEFMLSRCAHAAPWRWRLIRRILTRNPLLCVSRQAERLYRDKYGASSTQVIYECVDGDVAMSFDPAQRHIVMVGTLDARKGVELFSHAADLAALRHPNWRFHWIGGLATRDSLYRSPNVQWHGWRWHPREYLRQADLFLLASNDDPCPLAALEAMAMGKRCVAFRGTGIAELVEGISGCAVFETYSAEACLAAVVRALGEPLATSAVEQRHRDIASLESFGSRLDAILDGARHAVRK